MPDLHNIFLDYNNSLSLTSSRRKRLTAAKKAVENTIKDYFRHDKRIVVPNFFIQGSYKMKTMIVKKDNTYDVDLGVSFNSIPDIEAKTLQKNVLRAVQYHTQGGSSHKEKCIRVNYQGEFNIDLPVYFIDKNSNISYLATKSGWEASDPKELIKWFDENNGKESQLQRIIKYLKAWSVYHKYKMPSGIALSVWAAKKYYSHRRDDIALYNTLINIKESFFWKVKCTNPASPGDDLIAKLKPEQKSRFKSEFKRLINDLDEAIESDDLYDAIKILKHHFGKRFELWE
jgi:hypothetical protein